MNEIRTDNGNFEINQIKESGFIIDFNPPVKAEWSLYSISEGKEKYFIAYVDLDFGMEIEYRFDYSGDCWLYGYQGLNRGSSNYEKVLTHLIFDLVHAFTYYNRDPSYSHLYWALYGNLKDRTKVNYPEEWAKAIITEVEA